MFPQVQVPMGVLPFVLILQAVNAYDGRVAVLKTPYFNADIIDNDEGQEVRGEFYPDFFRLTGNGSTDEFLYGQFYSYKYIPNLLKYLKLQNVQNPFQDPLPDPQPEPGWQPAEPEVGEQPEPVDPVVFVNVPTGDVNESGEPITEHMQTTASDAAAAGLVDASLAVSPAPVAPTPAPEVEEAPVEAPAPVPAPAVEPEPTPEPEAPAVEEEQA